MRYCKLCVQPDTRPGIVFDSDGVCPACRFAAEHKKIDWKKRRKDLEEIADYGRKHNVSGYDCIIGVSGGKDSTRQAIYVKEELGLNALLVCCGYSPEQFTERGAHNISNIISLGFDCLLVNPDPVVWKKMMREGFLRHGNWAKSTESAIVSSLPKLAIAYHIPLVFYGESPAIMRGALSVLSEGGDASVIKNSHTMEGWAEAVKTTDITEHDLFWYRYPNEREFDMAKLRLVYLGYFIEDFTKFRNAEVSIAHGMDIRKDPPEDIGDITGAEALDDDFVIMNQMMKYFKYGFGKVTDQSSEAVRLGMMTREKAVELVKKYDGKCAPRYIKKFCDFIGITEKEFWDVANRFRNPDIWKKDVKGNWSMKVTLPS